MELNWDDSTDDVDPQWVIRYDVYVNGHFDHSTAQLITRAIARSSDRTGIIKDLDPQGAVRLEKAEFDLRGSRC